MSRKKQRQLQSLKQPPVPAQAFALGGEGESCPEPAAKRVSWKFRIAAALLVPTVLLVILEVFLRLVGYGYSPAFFLKGTVEGKSVFYDNQKFGWHFFTPAAARTPRPVTLAADKKAIRVFVLGESAAMGDPDARLWHAANSGSSFKKSVSRPGIRGDQRFHDRH